MTSIQILNGNWIHKADHLAVSKYKTLYFSERIQQINITFPYEFFFIRFWNIQVHEKVKKSITALCGWKTRCLFVQQWKVLVLKKRYGTRNMSGFFLILQPKNLMKCIKILGSINLSVDQALILNFKIKYINSFLSLCYVYLIVFSHATIICLLYHQFVFVEV